MSADSAHLVLDYNIHVDSHHLSYLIPSIVLLSGPLVLTWPAQNMCTHDTALSMPAARPTPITTSGDPGPRTPLLLTSATDDSDQQLNQYSILGSKVSQT